MKPRDLANLLSRCIAALEPNDLTIEEVEDLIETLDEEVRVINRAEVKSKYAHNASTCAACAATEDLSEPETGD